MGSHWVAVEFLDQMLNNHPVLTGIAFFVFLMVCGAVFVGSFTWFIAKKEAQTNLEQKPDIEALTAKAEAGDTEAQTNLGWMYDNGEGVPKNDGEAVKWYRKAAELGYAIAQHNLAFMYAMGKGVAQDDVEAVKWYRKAAGQGFAEGQRNLGLMYYKGEGVSKDYGEALKWFRKAADQGHADSQDKLAFMYNNGKGVSKDDVEAYKWWHLAAVQGDEDAKKNKRFLASKMTQKQIAEAQKLSAEFKPSRKR